MEAKSGSIKKGKKKWCLKLVSKPKKSQNSKRSKAAGINKQRSKHETDSELKKPGSNLIPGASNKTEKEPDQQP